MSNRKNRSFKARDKKRKIAKNKEKRKIFNINRQHKRRQYKHTEKVLRAAKYVDIFTKEKLCTAEILVLAKGLKFIPSPNLRNAKKTLINDFNELARKMRCKYHFDNGSHQYNRHPFLSKSGYKPNWANNAIENYLFSTRIELEKIQIKSFKDNLPKNERKALQSLRSNDHIIIKKADKNSSTVVLDKELYIKMANDQLNDNVHYEKINESHTTEVLDSLNIACFDPRSQQSAEDYVQSVMSQTRETTVGNRMTTIADIHTENNVSKNTEKVANVGTKRCLSPDPNSKPANYKSDISELKSLILGLTGSMNSICEVMTKRMDDIEKNNPRQVAAMSRTFYIENDIQKAHRLMNKNLRNIVKAIGMNKLEMRGTRVCPTSNDNRVFKENSPVVAGKSDVNQVNGQSRTQPTNNNSGRGRNGGVRGRNGKRRGDIYTIPNENMFYLCGDWNSRCGDMLDYIPGVDSLPERHVVDFKCNTEITNEEVLNILKLSKAGKSPGCDEIPMEMYKNLTAIKALTQVFNICYNTGIIPELWS
ncbi:unnamed protein product [Mytilus coruscus]|uniref:Endonuclease/exonuclease/phosphatase domain-containing protein n=1 Tax=Mytilus coruscus TaxID=42192 RepID=A0A6J8ATH6_MYTCO|nr:unnamed protein product [Mytilus coruscus]